jgi:hypothetical protein
MNSDHAVVAVFFLCLMFLLITIANDVTIFNLISYKISTEFKK